MKKIKRILVCLRDIVLIILPLYALSPMLLHAEEVSNTPPDAVKSGLPMCTEDISLADKLGEEGIGESFVWAGTENSPLAIEQGGLVISFYLNREDSEKKGDFSFLFTKVKNKKTCFLVAGKKWREVKSETPWSTIIGGDEKKVGYCASFMQVSKELSGEGSLEVGFGFPDSNFIESGAISAVLHLFKNSSGIGTVVTDTVYKNGSQIACIDAKIAIVPEESGEKQK